MGRKSIKEDKKPYQLAREELGLTREAAAEALVFISEDRLEKIDNEKSLPHPDEVLEMARVFKAPELCNYFCSHDCPIGQKTIPEIKQGELSQITLEMVVTLNTLLKEKDRLMEITVDGQIDDTELEDFEKIREDLNNMSAAIESLKLWVEKTMANTEE